MSPLSCYPIMPIRVSQLRVRASRVRHRAVLAAVAAFLAPVGSLRAQIVTLDEGSFTITRGGAKLGREEFRIVRQTAGGTSMITARGLGAFGDTRITPSVQTDSAGAPERYSVELRHGAVVDQRLAGQNTGGAHFSVQARLDGGEAAREYLLEPGTVVLDESVFHHYYFVARRRIASGAAVRVPVLAPQRNRQLAVWLTSDAAEPVTVGGQRLEARHLVLTDRAGDRRELWVDQQGRVLRVLLPADGTEALRDDPPR